MPSFLIGNTRSIRTIHSSLAIEGNKLSVDEVRDIIDGKNVVVPIREIQEVKNAIKTYEMYPSLDPFKEKDILKAHQGEELKEVSNKVTNKVTNKSENLALSLLQKNNRLTIEQLAKKTKLSESGVKKILASLKTAGYIERMGSNKTGYWEVK